MKFAKKLQDEMVPEWKPKYMDYKGLKRLMKNMVLSLAALTDMGDNKGAEPYETTDLALIDDLRKSSRQKFLERLEDELEKVNAFYFEQEKDAVAQKDKILEQLKIVYHRIESSLSQGKKNTPQQDDFLQNQMTWAAWKGGKVGKSRKSTADTATITDINQLSANSSGDLPFSLSGSFSGLKLFRQKKLGRAKMKKAILEYYRTLDILKGYKTLNYTGFCKILKKFDKNTSLDLSRQFLPLVKQSYFAKSKKLDELSKEIEGVYQTVFADGDHRKAMRKLRLPDLKHIPHHFSAFRAGMLLGISCALVFLSILHLIRNKVQSESIVLIYGAWGLALLMAWLCGINFYAWDRAHINYKFIFELNPRQNLSLSEYFECLSVFTFLWSFFSWFSIVGLMEGIDVLLQPLFVNFALVVYLFLPLDMLYRSARYWFFGVLVGIFRTPFIPVYFKDFFVADQFQSLTYIFRVLPLQFCLYDQYNHEKPDSHCVPSKLGYLIFIGLIPAVLRFLQCCRRYNDTKLWFPHLANAAKYSTSFFASLFSGLFGLTDIYAYRILFIILHLCGTFFALYWDYIMDWGYFQANSRRKFLRKTLVYKWHWAYYAAAISNLVLRLLWVIPLFTSVFENKLVLPFILAVLEVFRRFQWNFFRVEYEHINNLGKMKATHELQLPFKADLFYNEMSPADVEIAEELIDEGEHEDEEDNRALRSGKLDIMEFSRSGSPRNPAPISASSSAASVRSIRSADNISI